MEIKNLELTDKQLPVLQETAMDLVKMPFDKKEMCKYRKPELQLQNLHPEIRKKGLGIIFAKVSILSGFKGEIPDMNKKDITELLMTRFRGISLNELDFAFKIDRYGYHGNPTPHFQIFNAEYVARVLNNYLLYKEKVKGIPNRFNQPINVAKRTDYF